VTQTASSLPRVTTAQDPARGADSLAGGRRTPLTIGLSLLALTKPRIIELLLVTTLPAMLLAKRGLPAAGLIAVTLAGGALAAGSANTLNCYLDRDIDAIMRRTSRRPLTGRNSTAWLKPAEALTSGVTLGIAGTLLLGFGANWLSAALADSALLVYVLVYTVWLKRRTPSHIVIGGARQARGDGVHLHSAD
jgi:heme o synthase